MIDLASIDKLLHRATSATNTAWPIPEEEPILRRINTWQALVDSDKAHLRIVAGWPSDRPYRTDPLPERIADAWAHYLYGQEHTITGTTDSDTAPVSYTHLTLPTICSV